MASTPQSPLSALPPSFSLWKIVILGLNHKFCDNSVSSWEFLRDAWVTVWVGMEKWKGRRFLEPPTLFLWPPGPRLGRTPGDPEGCDCEPPARAPAPTPAPCARLPPPASRAARVTAEADRAGEGQSSARWAGEAGGLLPRVRFSVLPPPLPPPFPWQPRCLGTREAAAPSPQPGCGRRNQGGGGGSAETTRPGERRGSPGLRGQSWACVCAWERGLHGARRGPLQPQPRAPHPRSLPACAPGTRGTAMNTNDAKEYLARREIPLLFEVRGWGWQRGGGWGRSGRALGGSGWGSRSPSHVADAGQGSEGTNKLARPRARPEVAAFPGDCRGPCP